MDIVDFVGGGTMPVQYELSVDDLHCYIRYRWGGLDVYLCRDGPLEFKDDELMLSVELGDEYDGTWGARETNVYLTLILESIMNNRFDPSEFPDKSQVHQHKYYRLGPQPRYEVGLEKNKLFSLGQRKRISVEAENVAIWIDQNPKEHEAFKKLVPLQWKRTADDLTR